MGLPPENFKTEKNRAGQGSCHRQSDGDTQNCQRRGRGYKTCRSRHKSKPTHQQEKEKDRRANSVCYIQRIDGRERPCASTHVSERIGPRIIFLLRFLCNLCILCSSASSYPLLTNPLLQVVEGKGSTKDRRSQREKLVRTPKDVYPKKSSAKSNELDSTNLQCSGRNKAVSCRDQWR